ncbi:MAG: methyltransferase domain-containing protein [Jaaginema sp. PMC 1079.18]|nr:methyltransferase domain-containing protein [Jaaginema sp. PMC 1080.18]MEC4850514.1 methyltransferase domain-containing protein [Jaaginema sp. PMC 1079.18]MEC4864771.1 methyltransferase domain-containing protein [Jaaginema sp. PMC 1078.18]
MTDTTLNSQPALNHLENAVLERYQAGAKQREASLCCPTEYDTDYLAILPPEIIEKDYGCGDPTRYVKPGETVVDLGSGAGKNCYILAQKVGSSGQVIGVDFNDEMLNLARKYQPEISQKLGYDNVRFVKGKIQDLKLDLDKLNTWLESHPVNSVAGLSTLESKCSELRQQQPLVGDNSVDVVVSNCVLNLVRPEDKKQLFQEIYRVLKKGRRAVISDIVCDETPTPEMMSDPDLWSGCLSGAFLEAEFLKMFEAAGFYGISILSRQKEPWQVINGIEFRSMTVSAYKGKEGACWERHQAVVYKGPWLEVKDDDNHVYRRGDRVAVCDKTFQILTQPDSPYAKDVIAIEPYQEIPLEQAEQFACDRATIRAPQETKGADYQVTQTSDGPSCDPGSCC